MSDIHGGRPFPPVILYSAAGLVALTMILALLGRTTGLGTVTMPESDIVHQLEVRFEDRDDGSVAAYTSSGEQVGSFESEATGFARGVLRGFTRERKLEGIGDEHPFVLTLWANGRLALSDPETERIVELNAFGKDNAAPFARLLRDAAADADVDTSAEGSSRTSPDAMARGAER
jgi:putative photosynthetic complex assembly protein